MATVIASRSFPESLLPAALSVLAAWSTWKALAHRAIRRAGFALSAVVAWGGAIGGFAVLTTQFPSVLSVVALMVLASLLAGAALAWTHQPEGRLVGRARHPVLIVNPRSGDGAARRSGLVDAAQHRGVSVVEMADGDDLAAIARTEAMNGADVLGMAGGDGSLAVVAGVAIEAGIPFVCIPSGTRNHFALDLGLDRSDPIGALDAFDEAFQCHVDVARVNGAVFMNNVSIGAYGEVVGSDEYRANKVGVALAAMPSLIGPDAVPLDLRFVDAGAVERESAVVLHVSNNAYDLGPHIAFGSRPSLVDGELGVVALVIDQPGASPHMIWWEASEFEVTSDGPIGAGVDGEYVELASPARFMIEPLALRVRIPRGAAGISPAARRPSLSARTLGRLLSVARGVAPRRRSAERPVNRPHGVDRPRS